MIAALVISDPTTGDGAPSRSAEIAAPPSGNGAWLVPTVGLFVEPGQRCGDVSISRPSR